MKLKSVLTSITFTLTCSAYFSPSQALASPTYKSSLLLQQALPTTDIWDEEFLKRNDKIQDKLSRFKEGNLCRELKTLDNKSLTHAQLLARLDSLGYKCIRKPLSSNPLSSTALEYLKTDDTTTPDPHEPGVAWQDICFTIEGCVVRIKGDGLPKSRRPNPHSSKAVLLKAEGDPGSYENEAFKIAFTGEPLPKGPEKAGLKECTLGSDELCRNWVDRIMERTHPDLKEPMATRY